MLTELLEEQLGDNCKTGTNNLKKNVHAEEPKPLDHLLSKVKVTDTGIFPASLRPVENIGEYIDNIWEACNTPLKNMKTFQGQRKMVDQFMVNLIENMEAYDARLSGNLVMRGSAYGETIADARGDFDYMLGIDALSSICSPKEGVSDPPGYVRLQLRQGVEC